MILNQLGQTYLHDDNKRSLSVGQEIISNHLSNYSGLPGIITEIRDGEDRESENETSDIYCTFKIPVPENPYFIEALERRFGCDYPDIPLDSIIMAPHMLEPKMQYQMNSRISEMLVLSYYVDTDSEHDDYILCISDSREILENRLKAHRDANENIPGCAKEDIDDNGSVDRYIYTSGDKYFCFPYSRWRLNSKKIRV